MANLALRFDPTINAFDLCFENGTLALDGGLRTLVVTSLFTDARAEQREVESGEGDLRGWWGDALEAGEIWGGKLWLLDRLKTLNENLRRAEDFARGSLNWMLQDGVASVIRVSAERRDIEGTASALVLAIEIERPTGEAVSFLFDLLWRAT